MADLQASVKNGFAGKRILVIGDLVADQFLDGTISRVSREAPVFILRHEQTVTLPGAAANAAANIASLGARPTLIGVAGNDPNGRALSGSLAEAGVSTDAIVTDSSVTTTTKVRVLAGQHYAVRQQVIRIDYEDPEPVSDVLQERLIGNLDRAAPGANGIIVSDYGCGTVTPRVFEAVRAVSAAMSIPLVVDSRYRLAEFSGATSATPNREEIELVLGKDFTDDDCISLRERLGYKALLITNGNQGVTLLERDRPMLKIDAVGPSQPIDVTGAGDTVIAAYTLGLASGLDFADAARVANHAGGIVVMKKGTAVATAGELCESLAARGASQSSSSTN
jgi:rfaE bifunctional protein kinase chain/domain